MPRLLSLNVGLPREVTWNGRTVQTAICKLPAEGRRMVRKMNIDGDGQADLTGHGGEQRAVFVYQMESYQYWEHVLGRNDFTYGQFGEKGRMFHAKIALHRMPLLQSLGSSNCVRKLSKEASQWQQQ